MAFTAPYNDAISYSDPDVDGIVRFESPAINLDLRFDWRAMDRLQEQYGDEFLTRVTAGLDDLLIADLAVVAAAASGKTTEQITEASPPILPLANACKVAWSFAWNGGELPEEKESQPEKNSAWLTLFGWRVRAPFERG
ncbi:MAG: hypothetical protein AAFY12_11880 [Pseudomonadota bacterium]